MIQRDLFGNQVSLPDVAVARRAGYSEQMGTVREVVRLVREDRILADSSGRPYYGPDDSGVSLEPCCERVRTAVRDLLDSGWLRLGRRAVSVVIDGHAETACRLLVERKAKTAVDRWDRVTRGKGERE